MSEYDDFENEDQVQESKNPFRARMKDLESEVKTLRETQQEAQAMKRELAMLKAGVPVDDPASKYFVRAYDGELSVEAIKQAAIEARILASETPAEEITAEREAWQRTNQVVAGAASASEPASWDARIRNAQSEQEVFDILREAQAAGHNL